MTDQTAIAGSATGPISDFFAHLPKPFTLPSPEEIYDTIMRQINPELTTSQLPLLDAKYKNESLEQAKARQTSYISAFQQYDEKFREYRREIEQKTMAYRRSVTAAHEAMANTEDKGRVAAIESEISS